ncbi:MAG: DNA-processing protein DprA [Clostridia bacterium]|nr:DNA-processing protein DprA [Clostridia bacterium]
MESLIYWIWLALRCGAGSESGTLLLSLFGSPRAVHETDARTLGAIGGIDDRLFHALCDKSLERERMIVAYCEKMKIGILTPDSDAYPSRLRAIHAKPLVLYYLGALPDFGRRLSIACVGTRTCSHGGRDNAFLLGYDLAACGAVVVSGLARGIDTAAHAGALAAGGHTVAVLGCGLDHVYPPENRPLMRDIARRGTLVTEFAPGTAPNARNFPIRNRIISGLSQATAVVEADLRSGSLITARCALRQGRDLFAYPGGAADRLSAGTNSLIRNGATLTTSAYDILREYELTYPHTIFTERLGGCEEHRTRALAAFSHAAPLPPPPKMAESTVTRERTKAPKAKTVQKPPRKEETPHAAPGWKPDGLSEPEREVLALLDRPMSCEELAVLYARKTGKRADVATLLGTLTMLEMGGFAEALPGGVYRARNEGSGRSL